MPIIFLKAVLYFACSAAGLWVLLRRSHSDTLHRFLYHILAMLLTATVYGVTLVALAAIVKSAGRPPLLDAFLQDAVPVRMLIATVTIIVLSGLTLTADALLDLLLGFHRTHNRSNLHREPIRTAIASEPAASRIFRYLLAASLPLMLFGIWFVSEFS